MNRWWRIAGIGVALSLARICLAAEEPASAPEGAPPSAATQAEEPSATPPESEPAAPEPTGSRFTPRAQQFLDAAIARLEANRHAEAERQRAREQAELARRRARERQEAQRLAIQLSRQKLRAQAAQRREAQRQLELARERQLKTLYQKALLLYQRGAYQDAAQVLQRLALMDPDHPLVKAAERLITRAELKHFEQRFRAHAELPPGSRGAIVPELEQILTQKRMELETVFKYAKAAITGRNYDSALKLLTAILVQDPNNRKAQQLIEEVELALLKTEEERSIRQVERDEQAMMNDVIKAQLLPKPPQATVAAAHLLSGNPNPALAAKLQEPLSFEFNDLALSDVLGFLADSAGVSIIPSPQLDLKNRRVSLKIKDMPLEQAIKYLAKSLSLGYRIEEDAILIATPEDFSNEPLQTRVFFLHNGLGPFALKTAALEPNPALAMQPVTELIQKIVPQPPGSKFVIDERSGALVVTNTGDNLLLLERLLSQLDITPIQVLIEARFIELTMTELEQLAFESVLTGSATLKHKEASDGTEGVGQQVASGGGFKFPALVRESEGLNLTLQGILTGIQFESVLHLLEESKKSKTLSAPRVTTLNNQTAQISVVEEFNYPTRYEVSLIQFDINGDGDFDDAGETEFANVPQDLQKRDIGILLHVTPSVGRDMKTITLVLAPEVSSFSQFRNLGGGVTVPEFTSSQLTTSVVIENGQTVALGGLMKDTTSETTTRVPILGDLPLIGNLFKQKEGSSTRKNLLIFITARVLGSRGQTA